MRGLEATRLGTQKIRRVVRKYLQHRQSPLEYFQIKFKHRLRKNQDKLN